MHSPQNCVLCLEIWGHKKRVFNIRMLLREIALDEKIWITTEQNDC